MLYVLIITEFYTEVLPGLVFFLNFRLH